jgi:hypothetical protein
MLLIMNKLDRPSFGGIFRIVVIAVLYVSAWIYSGATNQHLAIGIVAAYGGIWLHEGSHYFAGWLGNSEPRMIFWFVFPVAVEHQKIEIIDSTVIRFSGLVIFLWIPLLIYTVLWFILEPSPKQLILVLPIGVSTIMATTSDAIALVDPERYREMEMADEIPRESLWGLL